MNSGTSAIDVMRGLGGWPNFVGNESGEPFRAMYVGSYFDEAYNQFKDIMSDRVPIAIGTEEENKPGRQTTWKKRRRSLRREL